MTLDSGNRTFRHPPVPAVKPDRTVMAVVIILSALAFFLVLGALLLTGVIRFGDPWVTIPVTCREVDGEERPVEPRRDFSADEETIYCCVSARAFGDTEIEARWYRGDELLERFAATYREVAGTGPWKFMTSESDLAFYIDSPEGGWVPGEYRVEILLDAAVEAQARFTVVGERLPRDDGMESYTDPSGRFSIDYPEGWLPADEASLQQARALAGFIAPSGGYFPPRFVVVQTDFPSAEPEQLNGQLEQSGVGEDEWYEPYSLGDKRGVKRIFGWSVEGQEGTLELRSVQVLIQGEGGVYGVNCHCLASEFEDRTSLFNAVINNFRVYD